MKISVADCSWKQLKSLAFKCGLLVEEGGKHSVIRDKDGNFITTIPRKNSLDKFTAKGIIADLEKAGCPRELLRKCGVRK